MTYRLSELPTTTPDDPHRSANRVDPYWGGVWQHGSVAQWTSRDHLGRMEASGLTGRRPRALATDPDVALNRIGWDWEAKLDLLGVLSSWRTVTAEQFAAFTGRDLDDAKVRRVLGDLFALELVDIGALWTPGSRGPNQTRARMLRPTVGHRFDQLIRPRMSYPEWVSVTAGQAFLTGGQYDRHNTLTVELALRAAEFLPVATVLGERQAQMAELAYVATGAPVPPTLTSSQKTGDAVIVRADGLRIVVETTASWSKSAEKKAEAWARAMEHRPVEDAGFVVVFVVADRTDAGETRKSLAAQVRKSIARTVRARPGNAHNRTAERMLVVDWRDWFPAAHTVSEQFLFLTADRPSGRDGTWEQVSLLDVAELQGPVAMESPTAVAHFASGLRLVPHQLREGMTRPNLSDITVRRFGLPSIPYPLEHRGGKHRGLGMERGPAVPAATIPPRLVF